MAIEPNKEELSRIRDVFNQFDLDNDGEITTQELGIVLKGLGQEYTENELKEIVASVDADGTETINLDEFTKLAVYQSKTLNSVDELAAAFSMFDRDGNGYISSAELKFALKTLGKDVNDQEAQEIIIEADCDGDGQISYEEFAKLIAPKS